MRSGIIVRVFVGGRLRGIRVVRKIVGRWRRDVVGNELPRMIHR